MVRIGNMCSQWIDAEYETVDLGDKRLDRRLCRILARFFESADKSIKSACRGFGEVMGAYRFLNQEEITPDAVIAPHVEKTVERAREFETLFYVQDTSELDFTSQTTLEGSGPLTAARRRGYYLDLSHLFEASGLSLGTLRCNIYTHKEEGFGEADERSKTLPIEQKESFRWLEGYRHCCRTQSSLPDSSLIYLADAEADIYEIYDQWQSNRDRGGACCDWIIRKCHDRACLPLDAHADTGEEPVRDKIESLLDKCGELGRVEVKVKRKTTRKRLKGKKNERVRKARTIVLSVKSVRVELNVPRRPAVAGGKALAPVSVWVVQGKEIDPPEDEEPMDWILFTSLAGGTFEQAGRILENYALRWGIEVVFRVLKSGCRIEKLQLKSTGAVKNAIACYLVVAWRIIFLTKIGRQCPELPCECVFEKDEWQAIWAIENGVGAVADLEGKVPGLNELILLIARYGGYLGRKCDGPPGAQAMWVGLQRLRDFTLAWKQFDPLE